LRILPQPSFNGASESGGSDLPAGDSLIAFGRDGAVARGGTALPYYLAPAAFSEAEPEVFTLMAV